MIKTDLPVIVLRGIILLPNNDIRLEFDSDVSKNIIDVAELFHDNKILIISKDDPLEESLDVKKLSKIGIIGKISHRINLPDGKTRIVISGLKRAIIHEYLNVNKKDDMLEAIVSEVEKTNLDSKQEDIYIKKLIRELEQYIKLVPYTSNSVLSLVNNITDLDKLTDVVVPYLQLNNIRMLGYLNNCNSVDRLKMLLEDIYNESEMFQIEKDLDSKVKRELDNNQRDYLLREKLKVIKEELGDITLKENEIENIKNKINDLNAPIKIKNRLEEELRRYETLPETSPEINVVRNYIDWLLNLPWNKYTIDNDDLNDVKEKLDASHNGLEEIKSRIIEYLAVKKMTNSLKSPILCFVGPPGVGKTSLVFSIAAALNRKFVKISVGGVNDEAEIIGHRRTYLGANPGRIIQSLKKAKSSNPVFLIDEIDKMTTSNKGDPASTLLEILDPEQNKYFSDNYIEEEYDLSKVMFITTANYIEDIPEALKDRLEIIELSGYTEFEKLEIAKNHLIPQICKNHGVNYKGIDIKEKAILKIIRNYTKESGVRELERKIATIIRKLVTEMVINKVIVNKYIIDEKKVEIYLGKEKYMDIHTKIDQVGIVNGLAYTKFGGDVLPIEVNYFKGNGNLELTGSLGSVMKESAVIALNYIKANYKKFDIDYSTLSKNDIHIHVPEGAIKKDGPSAGIALTTAIISALTNKKIYNSLAFTGEITLRGKVLAIGGLKEKCIGALRNGIKTIILPKQNAKDIEELPIEVKDNIEFVMVEDYKEIFEYIRK